MNPALLAVALTLMGACLGLEANLHLHLTEARFQRLCLIGLLTLAAALLSRLLIPRSFLAPLARLVLNMELLIASIWGFAVGYNYAIELFQQDGLDPPLYLWFGLGLVVVVFAIYFVSAIFGNVVELLSND